ncbi:hypothetical protein K9L97_03700 [Candidatus Woesearchaeota archaeon]|nr:hypothetical protein [Candidatus Woesearchaeota archaeon]
MVSQDFGSSFYSHNGASQSSSTPFSSKNSELNSISKTLSDISSSLRIIEDKYYNLRKKVQITDQTILDTQRTFYKEKHLINDDLVELKTKVADLNEQIGLMRMEIAQAVKQRDFKVLEKYLDMWNPMSFVTRKELNTWLDEDSK